MEDEKQDLRIRRTKRLLSIALFDLMEEKPFNKISVNDICEKAMVHRATFYNHFQDKEDLLNHTLDEIQEELFSKSIEKYHFATAKEMYMSLIDCVIDFLFSNKPKIENIMKNSSEKFVRIITQTIKRSIRYLISKNKYKEDYTIPIDIMVDFFTGGISMIGFSWFEGKNQYSKEDLLSFCNTILDESMFVKNKAL
ncbi:MAG TPA: TetR/AcrR family transcriptional regulator [Clostridia bacterium]